VSRLSLPGLVAVGVGLLAGPALRADVPVFKLRHAGPALGVSFAPDGKTLVTVGADRTVRFWDPAGGQERRQFEVKEPIRTVAFSPDGKFVALAAESSQVSLYELANGKAGQPLNGYGGPVTYLGFSGAGTIAVCAQHLFFWDVATRQNRNVIGIGGYGPTVCALSPDGRQVAYAPHSGNLQVQDIAGFRASGYSYRNVSALTFAADSKTLAVALADKTVRLLADGKGESARLTAEEPVSALAFAADGKSLATGGADGTVRVWDTGGKESRRLIGHRAAVAALAFSPDGRLLASASADGTVRLWDVGTPPAPLPAPPGASASDLELFWNDLLADDAAKSRQAFRALAAAPALTVPFVRDHLRATAHLAIDPQVRTWLADLDDDRFAVRQHAQAELARLGPSADPALRQALAREPSVEVQRRIDRLLGARRSAPLSPDAQRALEGIELLVEVGTPEARQALDELAQTSLAVPFGSEVRAALERLDRRAKPPAAPKP
jgi:WD40 repeat protein